MTDAASEDPEVFLTQIDDALQDVVDAINEFLDKSLDLFNNAISVAEASVSGAIGGVKGFFTGGFDGAAQGYAEAFVNELLEDYNTGSENVRSEWREAEGIIREAIGALMGDPLKMSAISSGYRDAIELLGQGLNDVSDSKAYVEASWSGLAKTAYTLTSDNQTKALSGLSQTLADSADLLDDHAVKLVQYWSDQLNNLIGLAASVIDASGKLGDAGNWISGGAGVVVSVIANAATGASSIVNTAVNYWADLNIGSAGDWDAIQAKFGERGLEGDLWPDYSATNETNLNGPWTPATT